MPAQRTGMPLPATLISADSKVKQELVDIVSGFRLLVSKIIARQLIT